MMSPDSPMEILIAALAFGVAIGILVTVHEFGHFWVARRLGVRVLRFSIGFGKPLWQRVAGKDQVEYVIAPIPLGGYVKLLDEREGNVAPGEAHRAFNRQPVWKRVAILLAGPAFNLVFAVGIYWVLFCAGVPTPRPIVGEVVPDSIAAHAGLRYEDVITGVAGKPVDTLEEAVLGVLGDLIDDGVIDLRVRGADGAERSLQMQTGEQRHALTQAETMLPGLGFDFWRPRVAATIAIVEPDSPAAHAGLKVGDRIAAFDGHPVGNFTELQRLIEPAANRSVELQVQRDGATLQVPVTVSEKEVGGKKIGRIGIAPVNAPLPSSVNAQNMMTLQKYSLAPALGHAARKTWDTSILSLRIMGRIVTGDVSVKNISGPISIAGSMGFAARQDWHVFFGMLALISISLGLINLMPIPILDGGQIVYQLAELVKGRPVSERTLLIGQQIGVAMVVLLMGLAFYNDIARYLHP